MRIFDHGAIQNRAAVDALDNGHLAKAQRAIDEAVTSLVLLGFDATDVELFLMRRVSETARLVASDRTTIAARLRISGFDGKFDANDVGDLVARFPKGIDATSLCSLIEARGVRKARAQEAMRSAMDKGIVRLGSEMRLFAPENAFSEFATQTLDEAPA